jgi:hypothetical protein
VDENHKDGKALLKLVDEEQDQLRKDRKKNETKKRNVFATNEQTKKIKQILQKIEERKGGKTQTISSLFKTKDDYISRCLFFNFF